MKETGWVITGVSHGITYVAGMITILILQFLGKWVFKKEDGNKYEGI
jgi:hypothetical protein